MWTGALADRTGASAAFGWNRLKVGPSPTIASCTTSLSARRLVLFSALAIALFSVLLIRTAAFLG